MSKKTWKLKKDTTWRSKLEAVHANHGKVCKIPANMRKRFGSGTMLIPKPLDVDAIMRKVRKGKLITQSQIRDRLADAAGADCTCPLTSGIFMRIAAEAADEDRAAGKKRITPYWRTVRDDGKLMEKFPGGPKAQAAKLRLEGFKIEPGKGKRPPRVKDFERFLTR